MADEINPRQFISLDYANADMYSGLTAKPPTATPLNLPLENLSAKPPSTNQSALEQAYNRNEEIRRQSLFKEQQEAQTQREQALREREIARNQALQSTRNSPVEQPVVSGRDYEKRYSPPTTTDTQQALPSTGSPPPTAKGTAARANALIEPTATPAPAALAEAVPVVATGGILSQLPRALPQAAGRLAVPGVIGGIDFANRVVQGQSVGHAATSAVAAQVGFVGGFALGSAVGGPLLGYALGAVGGMAAGAIADSFFRPTPSPATTPVEPPSYPPLDPGQVTNALYRVKWIMYDDNGNPYQELDSRFFGKLGAVEYHDTSPPRATILCSGNYYDNPNPQPGTTYYFPFAPARFRWTLVICEQLTEGIPDPPKIYPAPPPDNLPNNYNPSPIGDDNTIPSGTPSTPGKRGKTRNVAPSLPSNNTPNGAAFFPGHGGLAPSFLPNPTQQPSNLGGLLPAMLPQVQPLPFAEPDDVPSPRQFSVSGNGSQGAISSGGSFPFATFPESPKFPEPGVRYDSQGNVLPTAIDGGEPSSFKPTPLDVNPIKASGFATSTPQTSKAEPVPDAVSPTPKNNTAPISKTPQEAQADKTAQTIEQQKKDFDDQLGKLTFIATTIAALTPAIQGIPDAIAKSPTIKAANKETIQGAVCEIAQPTGCLGAPIKKAEDAANQNANKLDDIGDKLNALNTAGQAVDLSLLKIINDKLGDQVPGGISKFMENIAKNTYVEKALSVLTFAITLHNALMLSNNLAQTLGGIINTVLGLILPKGLDGTPINIGEILGKAAHELIADSIGEANYTKLTQEWAMANRIYQASSNVFNALTNAVSTVVNALEVIGSHTAKIGNALKKWGVLGERAYEWFHPNPNFHNKYFNFLNNTETAANTIQAVVQIPVSIVDAKNQIDSANAEFKSAIKGDKNPDGTPKESGIATEENKDKKDEFDLGKTISTTLDVALDDIFDAGD